MHVGEAGYKTELKGQGLTILFPINLFSFQFPNKNLMNPFKIFDGLLIEHFPLFLYDDAEELALFTHISLNCWRFSPMLEQLHQG